MAAPEQVGIMTERETTRLSDSVRKAVGEDAEQLRPYPTYYVDPSLLQVEQLSWMNDALEAAAQARTDEIDGLLERIEELEMKLQDLKEEQ